MTVTVVVTASVSRRGGSLACRASNVRCLGFMLAALQKNAVTPGLTEVLWVAVDTRVVPALDGKIVARALDMLGDLDGMGLLDEGGGGKGLRLRAYG